MHYRLFRQTLIPKHRYQQLRVLVHGLTLAALLAGLIPPPLVTMSANTLLPNTLVAPVAELAEVLSDVATVQAAPATTPSDLPMDVPLSQISGPTSILTVTKTVDWNGNTPNGSQQFAYTIDGPDGFTPINGTISDGVAMTYSVPMGVYTVTETSPGAGWVTTYTVTNGYSTSSSAVVTLTNLSVNPSFAATPITGRVFNDINADGNITVNGAATESGIPNVTVTAHDTNGINVGTTTTDANGDYTLTPIADGPWRIEFTNVPSGYTPSRVHTGVDNGTSVQFVTAAVNAVGVNLGLFDECTYCQSDPLVVLPSYIAGARTSSPTEPSLYRFPYSAADTTPAATSIALMGDTGSLYGVAYDSSRDLIYAAAWLKRHADLGPSGSGAIYRIDPTQPAATATSLLIDLDAVAGIDTGPAFTRDLAAASSPSQDSGAFDLVGKYSLGDLEIDTNRDRLYAVNMYSRTVVAINLLTNSVEDSYAVTDPGCANANDVRPMGLGIRAGEVYVGVVCSAESSGVASELQAAVLKLTSTGGFFPVVVPFSLTYTLPDRFSGTARSWNAWVSTYPLAAGNAAWRDTYPQPLLSDIDWDASGNMLLSFRDRFGDQTGEEQSYPAGFTPGSENPGNEIVWTHSQILQACMTPTGWTTGGSCAVDFYNARVGENASTTGGLMSLPTQGSFMAAIADPIAILQQGTARWELGTALFTAGTAYVVDSDTAGPAQFAKGNGMGDVEALCDPAPIEIGNRVWDDLDGDGEQDAGEPGLNDLTVTLQMPDGITSTTTSGDGNYVFSVAPYTAYTITVATPSGYQLTAANTTALDAANLSSNDAISDTIDSDALLVNGTPTIRYTTGGPGQNNHGLDFGFVQPVSGQVDILNTAPNTPVGTITIVKYTDGSDGTFDFSSSNPVLDAISITTLDTTGSTVVTQAAGTYTISEDSLAGWQLANIAVSGDIGNDSSIDLANQEVTLNVSAGDEIKLIYRNEEKLTPFSCSAQTLTYRAPYPLARTDWAEARDLPQFDPTLGALLAVKVTGSILISNSVKIESLDAAPAMIEAHTDIDGTIRDPFSNLASVNISEVDTFSASAFDGTIDFSGTGGSVLPTMHASGQSTYVLTDTQMVPYIGTGNVQFTVDVTGASNASGAGNLITSITTDAAGLVTVEYCYEAAVPTSKFGDRVWLEDDGDGYANTSAGTPIEGLVITAINGTETYTTTTNAAGYYSFTVPGGTYTVTYGTVPASYGDVIPSTVVSGTSESGNAGSYAEIGDPDANHGQNTVVMVSPGEANWYVDFAFTPATTPIFDLALIKELAVAQPLPIMPGDPVTFTLIISNQGTVDAYDIDLIDYLPTGLTLADSDWDGTALTATTTIGQLAAGEETTVDITLLVSAAFTGTSITNWAEIADASATSGGATASDIDSTPDDQNGNTPGEDANLVNDASTGDGNNGGDEDDHDPATIAIGEQLADLRLTKQVLQASAMPGDTLTYQLTLTNNGPDDAAEIVIADPLPAGVSYLAHEPMADASYTAGTHTVTWTVASLAANDAVTLTVTVLVE